MAQILDMVADNMQTWLQAKLITDICGGDPTLASLVQVGNLQSDPVSDYIHVLVHSGNPADSAWEHSLVSYKSADELGTGSKFPAFEVGGGGGTLWWRRMSCEVGCYFITQGYNRSLAREYGHKVLGRLEYWIANCTTVTGLTDDYDEQSIQLFMVKSRFTEGGGPPTSFIWLGHVYWQVLTSRPF